MLDDLIYIDSQPSPKMSRPSFICLIKYLNYNKYDNRFISHLL